MSEAATGSAPRPPADAFGRLLFRCVEGVALAGGAVLFAMTLMSVASILGRALFSKPLQGDYELAQTGVAIAVAAFLPYCQMRGGHVFVDFFTAGLPSRARGALDAVGALAIAVIGFVVAWRMGYGLVDLRAAHDQSMILAIPTWYSFVAMIPCFALLGVTAAYTALSRWRDAMRRGGRE